MRVTEKKYRLSRPDYERTLRDNKYRCIGSGAFANVFATKNSRVVIKIGDVGNDGYLDYITKVKANNPLYPKVKKLRIFRDHYNSKWYAITLERLHKFHSVPEAARQAVFDRLGLDGIHVLEEPLAVKTNNPHMKRALRLLNKMFSMHNDDIHDGNIMFRKKGRGYQLVITDPVS